MTTPHIAAAVSLLLTLAAGWYSWHRCKAEPRRLTNAVWIGITLALLLITGLFMGAVTVMGAAFVIVAGLAPVLVFGLVVLLLWNGVVMWRRESHSLGNMLSLLSALGVIAAMALSMWMVLSRHALMPVAMWIALALTWVAAMLMGFLAYSWLYQRMVRSCNPDFVITLGAGLAAGKVTPLLAGRINRALEVYAEAPETKRPVMVFSGGRGADEPISEADAMTDYAVDKGLELVETIVENRSRNTEENLRNSYALVVQDPRLGPDATGVAVTSDYHAMRAALLARRLNVPVQVWGAKTAPYFWPSAVLREFVAVMRDNIVGQLAGFMLFTLPMPIYLALAQ